MEDLNPNKRRLIKVEPKTKYVLNKNFVEKSQFQHEKPMMYDAWTQTDAPFCQQYDPISSSYASPTELKLMEMMEALQEQLSIQTSYIQSLQQNVNAVQRSTTTSSPTTTATTEPSNYRIITDGVLEPVEIEEINRELMQQLHQDQPQEETKIYTSQTTSYDVKPTVFVTPNQKQPKILNFRQNLSKYSSSPSESPQANDSSMENSFNTSATDLQSNVQVSIGPNNTKIPAKIYDSIKWESASIATRKLLTAVFDRPTLATHTMTGKQSPAFKDSGKPLKQMLDQDKIKDIIFAVTRKSGVSEKEVRNVITTKCADENKMLRTQQRKRQSLYEIDNKENFYNSQDTKENFYVGQTNKENVYSNPE